MAMGGPTTSGGDNEYMGPGAKLTSKTNIIRLGLINSFPVMCWLISCYSTLIWFGEDYEYGIEQGYKPGSFERTMDLFGEWDLMFRIGVLSLGLSVLENIILVGLTIKGRKRIPLTFPKRLTLLWLIQFTVVIVWAFFDFENSQFKMDKRLLL